MMSAPLLALPNNSLPFMLENDVSAYGIGASFDASWEATDLFKQRIGSKTPKTVYV